jgi:hypothetical protein
LQPGRQADSSPGLRGLRKSSPKEEDISLLGAECGSGRPGRNRQWLETELAAAGVNEAQAVLKEAEINLGYTTIRAPISGTIVDRRVNMGQTVAPAAGVSTLFLIAKELNHLQVWVSVSEADAGNIKPGQRARFTVEAYHGQVFDAVVAADQPRLNASVTKNVVMYTVVLKADNTVRKLLPYLTAMVDITIEERPGTVPSAPAEASRPATDVTQQRCAAKRESLLPFHNRYIKVKSAFSNCMAARRLRLSKRARTCCRQAGVPVLKAPQYKDDLAGWNWPVIYRRQCPESMATTALSNIPAPGYGGIAGAY